MKKEVSIIRAETDADIENVRDMCRGFVTWVFETFPEHRAQTSVYFEPVKCQATLAALPDIHARPKGAMLLAMLDGKPVGCIMYHEMEPGIAEIKRLFVATEARGTGAGGALVDAVLGAISDDGYDIVRLDTTIFLKAATQLYLSRGFKIVEPYLDFPEDVLKLQTYMERPV